MTLHIFPKDKKSSEALADVTADGIYRYTHTTMTCKIGSTSSDGLLDKVSTLTVFFKNPNLNCVCARLRTRHGTFCVFMLNTKCPLCRAYVFVPGIGAPSEVSVYRAVCIVCCLAILDNKGRILTRRWIVLGIGRDGILTGRQGLANNERHVRLNGLGGNTR